MKTLLKRTASDCETASSGFPTRRSGSGRWVCDRFLQNLGVSFAPTELVSVDDQAPDVLFREVRFEVKEWLDQDRRRTDEYREELRQAKLASSSEELWEYLTPEDLTPDMIVSDIESRISGWAAKYEPRFRGSLDLLVYHNRAGHFFKKSPVVPSTDTFSTFGFRSVSMTTDSRAWVLWASPSAPSPIASMVGSIRRHGKPDS
jgi:hypothetical protein